MRLAWFSPLPPVPSGIAACSADVLGELGRRHVIDVFVHASAPRDALPALESLESVRVHSAHDFVWRHRAEPYDLTVYQVGNSSHHDYIWPYLFRYPGLTVLHDVHVHHARAAALLRTKRAADLRAEFAANHPEVSVDLAELAVAGFDSYLYYCWPMSRLVIEASRLTAIHSAPLARQLQEELPEAHVTSIRLAHGERLSAEQIASARTRVRRQFGISDDAVLFGVFGGLTPDKRIAQVLDALAAVIPYAPSARLLLAGASARHYDVAADIRVRGLEDRVTITGYLATESELTDCIAACDASLNLRWPTAREMSGPWLRALAAARPTITIDLAHLVDVPSIDPRTWRVNSVATGDRRLAAGSETDSVATGDRRLAVGSETYSVATGDRRLAAGADRPTGHAQRDDQPPTANRQPPIANRQPPVANRQPPTAENDRGREAVTIAIDILDEDHSLRLAMRRLATDPALRAALGAAGQRYWDREHSMPRMVDDYERVLAQAATLPAPEVALPPHLVTNGDRLLNTVLEEFGLGPVWS